MPNTSPVSFTIGPVKSSAVPGTVKLVTVHNYGTQPLTVTMSAKEIIRNQAGACVVASKPADWATVTPAHYILPPGSVKAVRLAINAGAAPGQRDLAAWATTTIGKPVPGTSVRESVALGSQYLVKVPGKPVDTRPPCVNIANPSAGVPAELIIGIVLVLFLLATGTSIWLFRRHHRHAAAAA